MFWWEENGVLGFKTLDMTASFYKLKHQLKSLYKTMHTDLNASY